jgi:predicted transposase/invertase (TIGR01784 family)
LANTKEGQVLVETGFIYLSWTSGLTTQQIIGIFQKISSKAASTAMSAAEQLINEGIQKGIQKGIERGIQKGIEEGIEKGIRAMLKLGMSSETIAAAMELPLSTVQSIVNRI